MPDLSESDCNLKVVQSNNVRTSCVVLPDLHYTSFFLCNIRAHLDIYQKYHEEIRGSKCNQSKPDKNLIHLENAIYHNCRQIVLS